MIQHDRLALAATPLVCTNLATAKGTGTIKGAVLDSSGAAMPEVEITVRNVDTSAPEFELRVDQTAGVNLNMTIGDSSQTVVVTGAGSFLDTDTADVGPVIDTRRVMDLPLNGRNFLDLMTLAPGVTFTKDPSYSFEEVRELERRVSTQYSIGGNRVHDTANPNSGTNSIHQWWNLAALSFPTNVLNHPVLGMPPPYLDAYSTFDGSSNPVAGVPNPFGGFGTITNTAIDNRQIQCALKLVW